MITAEKTKHSTFCEHMETLLAMFQNVWKNIIIIIIIISIIITNKCIISIAMCDQINFFFLTT